MKNDEIHMKTCKIYKKKKKKKNNKKQKNNKQTRNASKVHGCPHFGYLYKTVQTLPN